MLTLVTGADGLLGTTIVRALLDRGDPVRVLLEPGCKAPTLEGLAVERHESDLSKDDDRLGPAAAGCQAIIHAAAVTGPFAPKDILWAVNADGTRRLFRAAREAKTESFVLVGTANTIGPGPLDNPGDETCPLPQEYSVLAYATSKQAAVDEALLEAREGSIRTTIVAPTFMLGEHLYRPSSGELVQRYLQRPLPFAPPGGKSFVHVSDVAACCIAARDKGENGRMYLAAGENLTYLDFFERVAARAGVKPPMGTVPAPVVELVGSLGWLYSQLGGKTQLDGNLARIGSLGAWYSNRRAVTELGMPQTPVDQGIDDVMRGLRLWGHL